MYQKFLLGGNKVEEATFLAGCRTMMEIFAHAPADGCSAILSRNDPDWILFLCEQEAARKRREQQQIAETIAQNYSVDKAQFRGMLLDRARVNDNGEDVDENGNVCERQPYPRHYWDDNGNQLTESEYDQLSFEQQEKCEETLLIDLKSKIGDKTRSSSAYNRPLIERLLVEFLPQESPTMLNLYLEELRNESNEIIQTYRDLFGPILGIHDFITGFEAWLNDDDDADAPDDIPEDTEK